MDMVAPLRIIIQVKIFLLEVIVKYARNRLPKTPHFQARFTNIQKPDS